MQCNVTFKYINKIENKKCFNISVWEEQGKMYDKGIDLDESE